MSYLFHFSDVTRVRLFVISLIALTTVSGTSFVSAQEDEKTKSEKTEGTGGKTDKTKSSVTSKLPLPLNISRRTLANFITDKVALAPYLTSAKSPRPFRSTFVIDSPKSDFAVIWDHQSCRIVGVVNLKPVPVVEDKEADDDDEKKDADKKDKKEQKPPSPYVIIASGTPPLAASVSSSVLPKYFGFRVVENRPQFLYSLGKLAIEESLWLDSSGKKLLQRFRISNREEDDSMILSFPEDWKNRIEAKTGKWKDSVLTIGKEDSSEFLLTYRLTEKN